MFFENSDFDFKILSVLYCERKIHSGSSGMRPFHALSFRLEGDAFFTFADKNIYLSSNDFLFCPKNCPYDIYSGNEKLIVVHFDSADALPPYLKKLTVSDCEIYKRELNRLYSAWTAKRVGFEHECKYILHKIFMNMEREAAEKQNKSDQISNAVDYIHDHFCDNDLNVSKLARLCSMSDTYFRRLFKEKFGVTPLKYINKLRTDHAVELLKSNYYTVTEIAEKCGFENVYYFSLFIKKETGKTPSQFVDK